jgi:hypothetical protein
VRFCDLHLRHRLEGSHDRPEGSIAAASAEFPRRVNSP